MKQLFSLDWSKDRKLVGKLFTLKDMEVDDEGKPVEQGDLRARLVDINHEGYYVFKVTTKNSNIEEFSTRVPNDGDVVLK